MHHNSSDTDLFEDFEFWEGKNASFEKEHYTAKPQQEPDTYLWEELQRIPAPRRKKRKSHLLVGVVILAVLSLIILGTIDRSAGSQIIQETEPAVVGVTVPSTVQTTEADTRSTMPAVEQTTEATSPTVTETIEATETTEAVPVTEPLPKWDYRYNGARLSEEEKRIYVQIVEAVACRQEVLELHQVCMDVEPFDIACIVVDDYPEYFWFRASMSWTYYDYTTYRDYVLTLNYTASATEWEKQQAYVQSVTEPVVAALADASDYDKVLGVYTYLIDNTVYDLSYRGMTIYELFHDHRAVCEGYARAAQYLLNQLGVETLIVDGENHAWNIVRIEGEYYHMDVTWGDPTTDDGSQIRSMAWLGLTDEEILRTHPIEDLDPYPACTSTRWNYYCVQGRYLSEFSQETVIQWFQTDCAQGRPLELKCENEAIFRQLCNWLDNGGFEQVVRAVVGNAGYTYSTGRNDELYTLTLELI